jgi:hypothetical protein
VLDALLCEAPGSTTTRRQEFRGGRINNMEFMRLSPSRLMIASGSTLNGLFSSAQSDIGKFFRKTVKMNNLSREYYQLSMGSSPATTH